MVLWMKAPRAMIAMRGNALENCTISTVLWVRTESFLKFLSNQRFQATRPMIGQQIGRNQVSLQRIRYPPPKVKPQIVLAKHFKEITGIPGAIQGNLREFLGRLKGIYWGILREFKGITVKLRSFILGGGVPKPGCLQFLPGSALLRSSASVCALLRSFPRVC